MSSRKKNAKEGKSSQGSQSGGHFSTEDLVTAFGFDFSKVDGPTRAYYSEQLRERNSIAQVTGPAPSARHQLGAQMSNASGSSTPLSALGRAVVTNGDTVGLDALARVDQIITESAQPTDAEYLSLTRTLSRLQTDYVSVSNGTRDAKASLTRLMQYRRARPSPYAVTNMEQLESDDAEVPEGYVSWAPKDAESDSAIAAWKSRHPDEELTSVHFVSCLTENDRKSYNDMIAKARGRN